MNFIENLWRIIKIRINVRRHQIHNFEAMKRIIIEKWKLLTKKNYKRCIENMSRRIQLIIQIKGGSIKYWNCILIFDQLVMKFQRFNASCCILIIWGEFQYKKWGRRWKWHVHCTQTSLTRLYDVTYQSFQLNFFFRFNWQTRMIKKSF